MKNGDCFEGWIHLRNWGLRSGYGDSLMVNNNVADDIDDDDEEGTGKI